MPLIFDVERGHRGFADFRTAMLAFPKDPLTDKARAGLEDNIARDFLTAVFSNSPYLLRSALREVDFVLSLLDGEPGSMLAGLLADLAVAGRSESSNAALMADLRRAKRQAALLIAFCDIAGVWRDGVVTHALSDLADCALGTALNRLLRDAARKGDLELPDHDDAGRGSGLAVIVMGKNGARELNYSSDIDFMVFFDSEVTSYQGSKTAQNCFVRIVQGLVKMLQEVTQDGYVFRTDLRLRPDPGVTPVVISMAAAESYYEAMGQNWERAAMIKARAAAGDLVAGNAFLDRLKPFIWRRNLDFAAIEDVHSIKRQIHSHRGHRNIAVAGHNIKVGRGGIRDIEFFVQTQQLIAGGRDPGLRARGTCEAMTALRDAGWIDADVARDMIAAYHFHRRLEHRLQMIEDAQTHSVPEQPDGVLHIGRFLGFENAPSFEAAVRKKLLVVEDHYKALFEREAELTRDGNLVFTGTDDDPETLQSLQDMGYEKPPAVSAQIRGWHHGRYRATKSTRSRELLTKLTPIILAELAKTAEPDRAVINFDRFLSGLPAGVQLFSLLFANPWLLSLISDLLGSTPRLAGYISRNPGILDAVLAPDFFAPLPASQELLENLSGGLGTGVDLQEALDIVRRFVKERRFQIGVQWLRGSTDADSAGAGYADLAEAAVNVLLPQVGPDFAVRERRGKVSGGDLAVLAMGKFGSREMTDTSDLDLVFIYDFDHDATQSDGERPLAPPHYFARLSQRLLNALTAPTSEGVLYEVDMRLRPSGNKGPVATQLSGFIDYQSNQAWTWEHMALSRARVVAGGAELRGKIEAAIRDILCRERDAEKLRADALDMRRRIAKEHGSQNPWDMKQVRGGLIDLEFISQVLQLRHAHDHPDVLSPHNRTAFAKLAAAGVLEKPQAEALIAASELLSNLSAVIRISVPGIFDTARAPEGLAAVVCQIGSADNLAVLENKLRTAQTTVRACFAGVIGEL